MRLFPIVLCLPVALLAQTATSAYQVRGILLERDPQTITGEFSLRAADNQVFRFRFDGKTSVEREQRSIEVARLEPGEEIEVATDVQGSLLRYATGVQVLRSPTPPRLLSAGRVRIYRNPIDRVIPAGTLAFSGVVSRLNGERVILHTRASGDQTILLRQDTRYVDNGDVVDSTDLKPTMRVFVRAGKTLYNEIEAYQVVWGQILMPH